MRQRVDHSAEVGGVKLFLRAQVTVLKLPARKLAWSMTSRSQAQRSCKNAREHLEDPLHTFPNASGKEGRGAAEVRILFRIEPWLHLTRFRPQDNTEEISMLSIAVYDTSSLQDRLVQPSTTGTAGRLARLKHSVEFLAATLTTTSST
jgi:hypothetical protein